ncbi:DivIVA domain-containing protein [Pseudactinotalea terrae]|uniref:DivIVA domain-containing protein n=1 Tax=Pseudactinotalea terrae TaxID=1743262 RepID=UPI0012E16714|nr:DivIVA domain-containing protein [Pseudactinotalea terrae]
MALLTADDVLNKKFQPTKFREGYDQDEVDDFLDEVVNTLRALDAENAELKTKLEAAQTGAGASSAAPAAVAEQQTQQMDAVQEAPVEDEPQPEAAPEPDIASLSQAPSAASGGEPESATGLIALAQRVHDEYVNNGRAEADRILGEARAEAERVAREAEETRNRTLGQLEGERSLLERKIDELRGFERDYRTRLKSYLEGLLNDVEGRGSVAGAGPGESEARRP